LSAGEPRGGARQSVAQRLGFRAGQAVSCSSRVWAKATRSTAIMVATSRVWLIANVRLPACPGRSLAAAGRVLDRVLEA
jgi:hypothetical protein